MIHPPVAKACEPPGGIARLTGCLREHGVGCTVLDANLEGQLALLGEAAGPASQIKRPPGGIARLAGCLREHKCRVHRSGCKPGRPVGSPRRGGRTRQSEFDTWTNRARRRLPEHLARLRGPGLYGHMDRYRRCVNDINRLLERRGRQAGLSLSLADYQDPRYSPLKSADLLRAACEHESNPFHPWFVRQN